MCDYVDRFQLPFQWSPDIRSSKSRDTIKRRRRWRRAASSYHGPTTVIGGLKWIVHFNVSDYYVITVIRATPGHDLDVSANASDHDDVV